LPAALTHDSQACHSASSAATTERLKPCVVQYDDAGHALATSHVQRRAEQEHRDNAWARDLCSACWKACKAVVAASNVGDAPSTSAANRRRYHSAHPGQQVGGCAGGLRLLCGSAGLAATCPQR
jgi:hypothetical protein